MSPDEFAAFTRFREGALGQDHPSCQYQGWNRREPCKDRCAATRAPAIRHVADESAPYETITVDKLTPIIGAEIAGIDLSQPLSNRQQDEVHRALAENCVIFFRDQHITPDQHLAFGRLFGDLHVHPAAPHEPGKPELMIIHADKDSPRANGEGWHTDVSCDVEPPMGSILYIKKCPPKGGDTLFATHVRRLRGAVGPHEDLSRRPDRDP